MKVWTGTTRRKRVQERLCNTVLQYSSSELEGIHLLFTGKEMYCTDPVIREFPFFRGCAVLREGIAYDNV